MIKNFLHTVILIITLTFTITAQNSNISNRSVETPKSANSTVRGRVYYADTGRAVKRASIMLILESREGGPLSENSALTDGEGRFQIKNMRGGVYYAIINAPGVVSPMAYADFSKARRREDEMMKNGFANFDKIVVDGVTDVDVQISARRGAAIGGRVLYDDGDAAIGVKVELLRKIEDRFTAVIPNFSAVASVMSGGGGMFQTDDRGVYRFPGLPAGEYIVKVTESANHSENAPRQYYDPIESVFSSNSFLTIFYPDAFEKQAAQIIKVELGQEISEINLVIPSRNLYKLEGKLVSRRDKTPVKAKVSLERRGNENIFSIGGDFRNREHSTLTDDEGNWKFKELPKGTYKITIDPVESEGEYQRYQGNYPMNSVNSPANTARNTPPKPKFARKIQEIVIEDKDQTDLIFEMGYGAKVSGVVTVENSEDFPNTVILNALDEDSKPLESTSVWSGDDGEDGMIKRRRKNDFQFENIPEGKIRFSVDVSDEDFYVKSADYNGIDLLSAPVEIKEGEILRNVKIVLGADAGTLKGKVLDDGKEAVKNAKFTLIPVDASKRKNPNFYKYIISNEAGEFEKKLAPGEYAVINMENSNSKADEDFYKWLDENIGNALKVTIKPSEKTNFTIKLPK